MAIKWDLPFSEAIYFWYLGIPDPGVKQQQGKASPIMACLWASMGIWWLLLEMQGGLDQTWPDMRKQLSDSFKTLLKLMYSITFVEL